MPRDRVAQLWFKLSYLVDVVVDNFILCVYSPVFCNRARVFLVGKKSCWANASSMAETAKHQVTRLGNHQVPLIRNLFRSERLGIQRSQNLSHVLKRKRRSARRRKMTKNESGTRPFSGDQRSRRIGRSTGRRKRDKRLSQHRRVNSRCCRTSRVRKRTRPLRLRLFQ